MVRMIANSRTRYNICIGIESILLFIKWFNIMTEIGIAMLWCKAKKTIVFLPNHAKGLTATNFDDNKSTAREPVIAALTVKGKIP